MFVRPKAVLYKSILLSMVLSLLGVTLALADAGDLDTTFSGDGWVVTDFNRLDNWVADLTVQPDGKIVAAGGNAGNFALVRYTPDGRLDRTFGINGRVQTNFGGNEVALYVTLQADGRIFAGGPICRSDTSCAVALARYTPDGALDRTFGGDGKVVTTFGVPYTKDLVLQPDGKIVVCSYFLDRVNHQFRGFVQRYLPDGRPDPTFSGDGKLRIPLPDAFPYALDLQPDGKIVVVGSAYDKLTIDDVLLVRLNPDGTLDPTFSRDGIQRTNITDGVPPSEDQAYRMTIQPNGKIVVVGQTLSDIQGEDYDGFVLRYKPNGVLDPTFSGDGKLVLDFAFIPYEHATGVIAEPDGKLVVGVYSAATILVRLQPNGAFDPSFQGGGAVDLGFDIPVTLARQSSDGKYVLGGGYRNGDKGYDFLVARVLP